MTTGVVRTLPAVASAIAAGRAVVALESSVLAQGLPAPANRTAATSLVAAVEARGAVAAIAAVVRGIPTAGLTDDELERFLARDGIAKVSARELGLAIDAAGDGEAELARAPI